VQAGGAITGDAVFSNTTVQAISTITGNSIVANTTIQATGVIRGGAIESSTYINGGTITGQILYSNTSVQAAGTITGQNIYSNSNVQAAGTVVANAIESNTYIRASNLIVSNISEFNVVISDSSITAATYILANNFLANVNIGIGTGYAAYPLDVWGNIHIANTTSTSSGIVFSDGSYQATAAINTKSFGTPGTVQIAGAGNTFSGNGNQLQFNTGNNTLITGNVFITSNVQGTSGTDGALVVYGGAGISGNLYVLGNIIGSNISAITGNSGSFFGDSYGFNALYAGIPFGYTVQPDTVVQLTANSDSVVQANIQNINPGTSADSGWVATADTGDFDNGYMAVGINNSGYDQGTIDGALDSFLYAAADVSGNGGNINIITFAPKHINFATGGGDYANLKVSINYDQGLAVFGNMPSTDSASGALIVNGGAGISGNINIGSSAYVTGNISASGTLNIVGAADLGSLTVHTAAQVNALVSNTTVTGNTWVLDGNAYTSTSTFQQVVDAWPVTAYRTAHYLVQVTDQTNSSYQSAQVMLIHDGTDVYITEYNDIYTNGSLGDFEADIVGGVVELLFTPISSATMTIKTVRTTIDT
jgi:hypothetical protein